MANGTIIIDDNLRTMTIPSSIVLLGVESDDDVNRIPFQMPKEYCGYDLSTFEARINYMNANGDGDLYIVDDLELDGDDPSLMNFTWLVGRNACAYKGNTQFIVCLKKFDANENVVQEFNTTVYQLPVLEGLETTQAVVQQNPDIIEYILKLIEDAGIIDLQNYYTKQEVNALKLPNPYPLTINGVDYDGSEAVEMTIEGGSSSTTEIVSGVILHVEDAVPNASVKSLALYNSTGDSIQSAPIAITNKNLFRIDLLAQQTISKGITFEKLADGSIHATGTSTGTYASAQAAIDKNAFIVGKTYTISSGKLSGSLYVQLLLNYTDGTTDYLVSSNTPYTFTLAKEVSSATASVQITASGLTIDEYIYPMIELAATASAFVNNIYNVVNYTGLTMPTLPASISNVWSTDDSVSNIVMEYSNDPLIARVDALEDEINNLDKPDDALDAVSENAVKNKAITAALAAKLDNPNGGTTGQVLTKTADGHEWKKAPIDGSLSSTSTNAVQNKVVTGVLTSLSSDVSSHTASIAQNASDIAQEVTDREDAISELESIHNYKSYGSVTELGLTAGEATIVDLWNALSNDSIYFGLAADFASSEVPSTNGSVLIIKKGNWRGVIEFYGTNETYGDYKMYTIGTGGTPDGVWHIVVGKTSQTIIPSATGVSFAGGISCYKSGNVVEIKYPYNLTVDEGYANTNIVVATIPEGYRPNAQTVMCNGTSMVSAIFKEPYRWELSSSGQLTFISGHAGIQEARCHMCFIV